MTQVVVTRGFWLRGELQAVDAVLDIDLPLAVEWMTAHGVRFAPGGIRQGAAGHDICFIHPKGNEQFPLGGEGVLIELVQAPEDVIAALG